MTTERTTGEWSIVARQQAAVAHVGQLGLRGVRFEELLAEAMRAVGSSIVADTVILFELAADWRSFTVRGALFGGRLARPHTLDGIRIPAGRDSLPGYTVMRGEVVQAPDLLDEQRFRASAPDFDMSARSGLAAPVGWGERPWGVLAAYTNDLRTWNDDDLHFVQSMANTLGLAVYRRDAERALVDSSARLELSLSAGGLGAWEWDFASGHVELSASASVIFGLGDQETVLDDAGFLAMVHPDDRVSLRGRSFEMLDTSGEHHAVYRAIRRDDAEIRWLESWGRVLSDHRGPQRLVGVVADITERRQSDATKEAMLAAEQGARVEAEQVRERLTVLAELGSTLMATLDPDAVVGAFPGFCVPQFADVCLLDLVEDDGDLVEVSAAAVDDDLLEAVREVRRRRSERSDSDGLWNRHDVVARGERLLIERLTDEQFQRRALDTEHLALLRRVDARSAIVVPLVARGRVAGLLTLIATGESGRSYGPDDLALVSEMADRVALAHDNARLFASRNRVARTLQAALLPPALPEVAGLDLAARYRVAEDDIEIGGDFYDVIEMADRVWGVVVGDVCGRGPDAAALTGLMRHSVRAAVVRERLPSRVLAQTNDAVLDQIDDSRFCTATYLRLELSEPGDGVRVLASSAGHPRPVLLRADGHAEVVPSAGVLLGVVPAPELVDVELQLEPGDAVVVYTDGVTEARRGPDQFGEDRLIDSLRELSGESADGIAQGLLDRVEAFAEGASDDRALLVVRVDTEPVLRR